MEQLARNLREAYAKAQDREKVIAIHLFGIEHADEISNVSIKELAKRAGIHESYATEIRKGMNLAKFVELKR
jgi:DNA-binding MurR/RpiR family transcriptional regulator